MVSDNQQYRWYACVNDLIGGWAVNTADVPSSQLDYAHRTDHREVACFATQEDAEHIANLHNASRDEDHGPGTENEALARELEVARECHVEQRERADRLAAAGARLRAALIHTRHMVMAHHILGAGECSVCVSESGRKTWDEGDAAINGG